MISKDGEKQLKTYCLFHKTADCSCINPVVEKETLIKRIEQEIKLNHYLNGCESDFTESAKRDSMIMEMKMRLKDLMFSTSLPISSSALAAKV